MYILTVNRSVYEENIPDNVVTMIHIHVFPLFSSSFFIGRSFWTCATMNCGIGSHRNGPLQIELRKRKFYVMFFSIYHLHCFMCPYNFHKKMRHFFYEGVTKMKCFLRVLQKMREDLRRQWSMADWYRAGGPFLWVLGQTKWQLCSQK